MYWLVGYSLTASQNDSMLMYMGVGENNGSPYPLDLT